MPVSETLESLLAQAGEHFTVAFEPLDVDGTPLHVLGVTNMRSHLDNLVATRAIRNPLKDLPLWAKVWPASFVMGRFLRKLEPAGKTLLEIGAGCGVAGCIAARYGFSHVTVSDIVPDALIFAKANVLKNGLEACMDVRHVDVAATRLDARFDIIAASEILYLDDLHRPLLKFLDRHLAAGGKAVFCTDWARRKPHFFKLAAKSFSIQEYKVGVRSTDAEGEEQRRLYLLHVLERS
ncbi:MAG: class I SAM-dependent methyltransferase [Desulfovibrionaceae bacterium]